MTTFTSGPVVIKLRNIRQFRPCEECGQLRERFVIDAFRLRKERCEQCFDDEWGPDDRFAPEPAI